jgi:putative membrane protein
MIHSVKAEKFFSSEERERIKETVQDVETRTIGEVAVMVVDSSDQYMEAEVMGGVFLSSFISLILTMAFFHSSLWWFILLSFIFHYPAKYIFRKVPHLKTAFIGLKRREHAVMQRAERAFYEKGLYKTRENSGVLFFLSLLERKVWVLADVGIYKRIEQDTLNKFADAVSRGIREGRACDALCGAIKESGEVLALHFPMKPGDTDELSDEVMTG